MKYFTDFEIGQTVSLTKFFSHEEFNSFSDMSGDQNPLHWNQEYSQKSEFGQMIVPLHMTMSPMSQIAGMFFPGDPSLYIGHEIQSILPVFYGDELTYSAQIKSINIEMRIITIRVLSLQGSQIVFDATMKVKSLHDTWEPSKPIQAEYHQKPNTAFITGGTGEIGTAYCEALLKKGWDLLIQDRGNSSKREKLENRLKKINQTSQMSIEFVNADLTAEKDQIELANQLTNRDDVGLFIHTASPAIDANIQDLVSVNYTALKLISNALIPSMLKHQFGKILFLSSIATQRTILGWEDYSACKSMCEQFITSMNKLYQGYGVQSCNILSGLVATKYSQSAQENATAMLPNELVSKSLELVYQDKSFSSAIVEWNSKLIGSVGFYPIKSEPILATKTDTIIEPAKPDVKNNNVANTPSIVDVAAIEDVVRKQLRLPDDTVLTNGGIGRTINWDSLRHIEVVLKLEEAFGIKFNSSEIELLMNFDEIQSTIMQKLLPNGGTKL